MAATARRCLPAPLRVSAELDYALRALVLLAQRTPRPCAVRSLVDEDMSISFVQHVLGRLREGGIVGARRGARGGYWLCRTPEDISVAEVVRALSPQKVEPAEAGEITGLDALYVELGSRVQAQLDAVSIADLATY